MPLGKREKKKSLIEREKANLETKDEEKYKKTGCEGGNKCK